MGRNCHLKEPTGFSLQRNLLHAQSELVGDRRLWAAETLRPLFCPEALDPGELVRSPGSGEGTARRCTVDPKNLCTEDLREVFVAADVDDFERPLRPRKNLEPVAGPGLHSSRQASRAPEELEESRVARRRPHTFAVAGLKE